MDQGQYFLLIEDDPSDAVNAPPLAAAPGCREERA